MAYDRHKKRKPLITARPPEALAGCFEMLGYDVDGNIAVIFKRPMKLMDIVGESDISLIGAEFPVGRILKIFCEPMEQAPTEKKASELKIA